MMSVSDQLRYLADRLDEEGSAVHLRGMTTQTSIDRMEIELQFIAFPNKGFNSDEFAQPRQIDTGRKIQSPKVWVRNGRNVILENSAQDFYISYNGNPGSGFGPFAGDGGSNETALVRDGQYYILNGDFREQYEVAIEKGWSACIRIFLDHEDAQSSWSNDYEGEESKR